MKTNIAILFIIVVLQSCGHRTDQSRNRSNEIDPRAVYDFKHNKNLIIPLASEYAKNKDLQTYTLKHFHLRIVDTGAPFYKNNPNYTQTYRNLAGTLLDEKYGKNWFQKAKIAVGLMTERHIGMLYEE